MHRGPMVTPQQFNAWNFVWLGIAAFMAYELGRGSDAAATYAEPVATPAPAGMHPDAESRRWQVGGSRRNTPARACVEQRRGESDEERSQA